MQICERITNMVIEKLEQGVVPWHKPWSYDMWPRNPFTKNRYSGINVFLLLLAGFDKPFWMTYYQIHQLGGNVKANEQGYPIVYWKLFEIKNQEGDEKFIPLLKQYTVFNIEQSTEINHSMFEATKGKVNTIDECEKVINQMPKKPKVEDCSSRAYYNTNLDVIFLPPAHLFESTEAYYSTFFHELVHSSGHLSRLNRKSITEAVKFGTSNYSREELIAEIGASFLCAHCSIEDATVDNSIAYISNWTKRLREKKMMIITAAAQAQKAYEYVVNNRQIKDYK